MSTHVTTTWRLPEALPPGDVETFRDLVRYCFDDGSEWTFETSPEPAVTYSGHARADVTERLEHAFRRVVPGRSARVAQDFLDLWDVPAPVRAGTPEQWETGPGLRVLGDGLARLAAAVDHAAQRVARELGAQETMVPHLVAWETIERAGYDRTFPQHLTACHVVGPGIDAIDRYADGRGDRAADLVPSAVCASPTVCMPMYAALADQPLPRQVVRTARSMCTRHEATNGPTRLWSFTMREIVYVGDRDGALDFRRRALDVTAELARSLGLPARLTAASDPFFTAARPDLVTYQRFQSLKHELVARVPGVQTPVAVASVNLHEQHFGRGFGITAPGGGPAWSACVGYGLERWAQWLHPYVGDDPEHWPDVLRGGHGA